MADNLTLALKIKADLNNALNNFKALEAGMQRTSASAKGLGENAKAGSRGFDSLGNSAEAAANKLGKTRAGVESISKQLERLQRLGTVGLGLHLFSGGIAGIARTADEFNNYQSRIQLVSKSNQEASRTFRQLMTVANDTGQLFGATAELYTRVYRAMGDRANSQELLQFTKTINQSMVVSGANAQEASAAIIQLSQGMASGTLRGEEFNSVAEQAPVILEMLQKSLGKTRGELRKMAEDGELTTEVVLRAVRESAEGVQAQYDQMPKTIGRAVNELTNAWMQFIGQTDGALSASSVAATVISTLAQHLNLLGNAALVVGVIMSGRLLAGFVATTAAIIRQQAALAVSNTTMVARAAIEVKAAQSALAMARATDAETAAVARLTAANRALAIAKGAAVASSVGGGLMALAGGPIGLAIIAVMGLVAAYQYLKEREAELEAQYNQTQAAMQNNIDKTRELIELRKQGQVGGFSDRFAQVNANNAELAAAQAQLDELIRKRDMLQAMQNSAPLSGVPTNYGKEIEELNYKIKTLTDSTQHLADQQKILADITQTQMSAALEHAVGNSDQLALKFAALAGTNAPAAMQLVADSIKKAEGEMTSIKGELDEMISKLNRELADATMTTAQQMDAMRIKIEQAAKAAGDVEGYKVLIATLDTVIALQAQVANAKQAKEGKNYLEGLRERQLTQGMTTAQRIKHDNRKKGLQGDDLAEADALADKIQAGESRRRGGGRRGGGGSKKSAVDKAAENEQKNLELNIQYLRLTGQEVKANLTDVESRYNRMIGEFQKAGNVDGINLIKKILPLEQAKVQVDGLQTEINKLFQNQSAQEQSIQAQVQTGLITHLAGQQKLKEVYAQTVSEIEKQLPLLERLAKMPGQQGEQARAMLEQMKLKIVELKTAGNELQKAFEDGLTRGIESSLMGLAQGTMTLKDAIKNLALTVVNAMAQVAAQQLALQAVSGITGLFGGAAGASVMAATGGYIRGPGTGISDSIPARLSNGEFVVREAMVRKYGVGFLHAINRGRLAGFADGGLVSSPAMPQYREPGLTTSMQDGTAGQIQVSAPPVNIKQTLAVDSAELFTAGIGTVAGERAVMTTLIANKDTIKQALNN